MKPTTHRNGHLVQDILQAGATPKDHPIFKEIQDTLGIVPGFFRILPKQTVEHDWKVMRDFQLSDKTALDPKTKELIGLAVAAAMHCRYCSKFHSEAATLNGASMEEINEALVMAKHTRGWSAYLNGLRYDWDTFETEVGQIVEHVKKQQGQKRV